MEFYNIIETLASERKNILEWSKKLDKWWQFGFK